MLLDLLKPKDTKTKKKSSTDNTIKSYDKINYFGGVPEAEIANKIEGTLHIYKGLIVFDDGNSELFNIQINNINKCSLETKESLNVSRDGLKDVLVTELEEDKLYIKIKYTKVSNGPIIVVMQSYFNDAYSKSIVEEVNKRMN